MSTNATSSSARKSSQACMLALPQPEDSPDVSTLDGIPSIPLAEDSAILLGMLPYFYPYSHESTFLHNRRNSSVNTIFEGLCFIDKYEMHHLARDPLIAVLEYAISILSQDGDTQLIGDAARKRIVAFKDFVANAPRQLDADGDNIRSAEAIEPLGRGAKSGVDEFFWLFQSRSPVFLKRLKAQLLPYVARYASLRDAEVVIEEFSEGDKQDVEVLCDVTIR